MFDFMISVFINLILGKFYFVMSKYFRAAVGFGVEVEQARLGIPTERPLAVPQWNGVIAVNCAARAAGGFWWERVSECQG